MQDITQGLGVMCEMWDWILARDCLHWDSLSIIMTLETFRFYFLLKFMQPQDFSSHFCCVKIIPQFSSRNYNHLILLSMLVRNLGKAELSSSLMQVHSDGFWGCNVTWRLTWGHPRWRNHVQASAAKPSAGSSSDHTCPLQYGALRVVKLLT